MFLEATDRHGFATDLALEHVTYFFNVHRFTHPGCDFYPEMLISPVSLSAEGCNENLNKLYRAIESVIH